MLTVTPAKIVTNKNGVPHSVQFNDTYFSLSGGVEECRHVFLNGNNIKPRIKGAHLFTVAEIGFGTGLNFLTACKEWEQFGSKNATLHYISIEKHPLAIEDLQYFYSKLPSSFSLLEDLLAKYPLPISGSHRIEFRQSSIVLTLILADALTTLKKSNFEADAWFLDGFSPNKNPDLWSIEIAREIFRLTKTNGSFATYTSAGTVKKNFSSAGFQITKQKGFGEKRDMLTGIRTTKNKEKFYSIDKKSWFFYKPKSLPHRQALIIGGGLAGTTISAALARRNWQVTLIDQHTKLASEASGNTNAILMPRLSVDHDIQAQLTLLGFFYSLRYLDQLQAHSNLPLWHQCGAVQIPRDLLQKKRMLHILSQENLPSKLLRSISREEASELANCDLTQGGWYFPLAGWVAPQSLCNAIKEYYENISFIGGIKVGALENQNGTWHALDNNGHTISNANVVILASALSVNKFHQTSWCELFPKRGQISLIPSEQCSTQPAKIVCSDAYITPTVNDHFVIGATFITNDTNTDVRSSEHLQNIAKINKIIPSFIPPSLDSIKGRAAIRAVSTDRLPIVGPVANETNFKEKFTKAALGATNTNYPTPDYLDGLYIATGFGSRGLAWIPLCAEVLACTINNEPSPLNQPLSNAIHPNRILMKQLIKSVQYTQ